MRKISLLGLLLFLALIKPDPAAAKKILPRFQGRASSSVSVSPSSRVSVSPRLRSDRLALVVTFGNLQNASSVTYGLTYLTADREEGAGGTIRYQGDNLATRELLFGTCSKGVCRYHSAISNMKFEVISTLNSGVKILKRYRVRV